MSEEEILQVLMDKGFIQPPEEEPEVITSSGGIVLRPLGGSF